METEKEKSILSPVDGYVYINKGELLCGVIDKNTIGNSPGGLIHILMNDIGKNRIYLNRAR